MVPARAFAQHFRRWRIARALRSARRRGHGLYCTEFAGPWSAPNPLPAEVLQWCRDTVWRCRRPMGIDHFDLTLTVHGPGTPKTHRLAFLRPLHLYDETGLHAALTAALAPVALAEHPGGWRVAVSLLSWGDLAHAALPA